MARHAHIPHSSAVPIPAIHQISSDKPWLWLAAGWGDFVKAPAISLAYGLAVTLVMLTVFQLLQMRGFFLHALAMMAGFALIGPLLAVGLYEISRRLEQHQQVRLADTWRGWRRNSRSLLAIGMLMMLIVLFWIILATRIASLAYGIAGDVDPIRAADWQSIVLSIRWPVVVSFGLTGLIAVSVSYVITVVSVPLLMDREEMDMPTAIVVSARTVRKNSAPLILWAVLIAIFTGVGVAPLFLGLIVVFPLLAYSSWHAFRDLIEH